jgi:hypothetical protein
MQDLHPARERIGRSPTRKDHITSEEGTNRTSRKVWWLEARGTGPAPRRANPLAFAVPAMWATMWSSLMIPVAGDRGLARLGESLLE